MKRIIIFAGFYFTVVICIGQSPEAVDSLKKEIRNHTKQDSFLVRTLLNYADAIVFENTDSAMKYTDDALQLAQKLQWQKGIASALREKGLVYYYTSDKVNAMDYSQKALKAGESMHNKLFDASVYSNIGNIYADLGEHEKALGYYNKLLEASREIKHKKYETVALVDIGTIYTEKNDFIKGLEYFKKGLEIAQSENDIDVVSFCLANMGIIYKKKRDYNNALNYLEESIKTAEKANNKNDKATSLTEIADVYIEKGDYNKAEKYSLESLALAKEINHVEWQANAYRTLSNAYEKEHKNDKALAAYKNYIMLRDSIINDEKKQELTRKEIQFEFDKKEALAKAEHDKQQALAASEIQRQTIVKNSVMGGAGIILFTGIAGFVFYKRNRDIKTQHKEAELNAEIADTEMKALRAQMNPHFIFNSLNSISDYIEKNDLKAADEYLTKFAKVMRLILENSEQKQVSLSDDLKALELYMQLESLRLKNKFSYEIKVDNDIDKENTLVPPLILQPFVENSIWHGLTKKNDEGKIFIYIKKEGEMLNCVVEDNGIGREKSETFKSEVKNMEKKSLGMKITRSRIDIINKTKKSNATIKFTDLEEGMRTEVKLPLELSF